MHLAIDNLTAILSRKTNACYGTLLFLSAKEIRKVCEVLTPISTIRECVVSLFSHKN